MAECAVIGLTGQTGAGKTLVCGMLRSRGYKVIDCDLASRRVTDPGTKCLTELVGVFGEEILNPDRTLNRRRLGDIVFADSEKLLTLNGIIFPHIHREIEDEINRLSDSGAKVIFLDAPTLFESGANLRCDKIVSVIAPLDIRRERILKRDAIERYQADMRIASQNPDEFYISRSDFIIRNDAEMEGLEGAVEAMLKALKLENSRNGGLL